VQRDTCISASTIRSRGHFLFEARMQTLTETNRQFENHFVGRQD
jgi:hypothetical protein